LAEAPDRASPLSFLLLLSLLPLADDPLLLFRSQIALTGLSNEVDRVASQDLIDGWLLKGGDSLRVLTEQLARLQLELDDRGDLDDDEPDTPISASSSPPYKLDGAPPSFTSL